jgi:hypothetical protein
MGVGPTGGRPCVAPKRLAADTSVCRRLAVQELLEVDSKLSLPLDLRCERESGFVLLIDMDDNCSQSVVSVFYPNLKCVRRHIGVAQFVLKHDYCTWMCTLLTSSCKAAFSS